MSEHGYISLGDLRTEQGNIHVYYYATSDQKKVEAARLLLRKVTQVTQGKPCTIDKELYDKLVAFGIIKTKGVNDFNHGESDYAKHVQSHWSVSREYDLHPLEDSILKRLLRTKGDRLLDLNKMRQELDELIRVTELSIASPDNYELPLSVATIRCSICRDVMTNIGKGTISNWVCENSDCPSLLQGHTLPEDM